jgi:uncharacterized protein (DUF1800 family)
MSKSRPATRKPSAEQTLRDVTLLLQRAGFGGTATEMQAAVRQGLPAVVRTLVDYEETFDSFTPPPDAALDPTKTRHPDDLTIWWLTRMITTSRPLQEKMTLVWHGHFATGFSKVRSIAAMYTQNQLFRNLALARFDDLLTAVSQDPAMLIWLDGDRNTNTAPNENFGREVMELFVLGRGNYSEDDVHAMARAFTGWTVNRGTWQAQFVPRRYDGGRKTILGQTGAWGSDDAVRILAAHPATGPFLAQKLWRFFASETPPRAVIQRMSDAYYRSDHSIREVVRTMLTSAEFYRSPTRGIHIKSPVEFALMPIKQLGLSTAAIQNLPNVLTVLGQTLFDPPNVGGWTGGPTWINPATMLARFNQASRITGDASSSAIVGVDPEALGVAGEFDTTDQLVGYLTHALAVSPGPDTTAALMQYVGRGQVDRIDLDTKIRGLIHLILISPEYQAA